MTSLISQLIYNALSSGQGVNLPGIGALVVEHRTATLRSRRRLIPPCAAIHFQLHQKASLPSVVDLLEGWTGERRHAEAVYGAWLEDIGARNREGFGIEGVGTIRRGEFTPTPGLERALNPQQPHPIRVKPRCGKWWIWLVVGLVVAALAFAGWYYRDKVCGWISGMQLRRPAVELPAIPAVDTATIVADSIVVDSLPVQVDTIVPEEDGTRYYVILGMFSTRENAEKAVWQLTRSDGALECSIVVRGSRFLVSAYSSLDEAQAQARKDRLIGRYPEVWIWKSITN